MNFRLNQNKVVHQNISAIKKEIVQERVGYCCKKQMNIRLENGIRTFACMECGKFFRSQDTFMVKTNSFDDIDKKVVPYGSRSGAFYKARMKEEVRQILLKTMETYNLSEAHIIKIMDHYFAIRDHRIPRANPRKGLILACVYKIARIPIEYLSKLYGIKQKYITEGLKAYRRDLTPYEDFSLTEMISNTYNRFKIAGMPEFEKTEKIVHEIISLSIAFYVAIDTTIKTKVAGAIYFLIETGFYKLDMAKVNKALDIGITTVYKFYDQLIVALHSDYNENIKHRREQLLDYFKHRGITIGDLQKKRMAKYIK